MISIDLINYFLILVISFYTFEIICKPFTITERFEGIEEGSDDEGDEGDEGDDGDDGDEEDEGVYDDDDDDDDDDDESLLPNWLIITIGCVLFIIAIYVGYRVIKKKQAPEDVIQEGGKEVMGLVSSLLLPSFY